MLDIRSMLDIRIPVTGRHIAYGIPDDPSRCALALALRDYLSVAHVTVGRYSVSLHTNRGVYVFKVDSTLREWVDGFDAGEVDDPITVILANEEVRIA